jgi:ParB family chromosome partitioning protein
VTAPKRARLGRGLEALLGEEYLADTSSEGNARTLPISKVFPNPFQPRREFKEEELADLRRSIEANGLLQPVLVRSSPGAEGERYELVAGERRLRAVTDLGWQEIPAVVRDVDDRTLLVLALVENIQREALSPLEEAEGFRLLVDEFGLTQEEIGQAVGRERSTVSNTLRLLKLPASIRRLLEEGTLSMGHARALLSIEDQGRLVELGRRAAREGWSVREVEVRARGTTTREKGSTTPRGQPEDPGLTALQEALRASLSARVRLRRGKSRTGAIEIPFDSDEEFARLFEVITGESLESVTG